MGSYAGLYVKHKLIFSFKNESYGHFADFFTEDELFHLSGAEAVPYATNWDASDLNEDEYSDVEVYVYRAKVSNLSDRMNIFGFTTELAQRVFAELINEKISNNQEHMTEKYYGAEVRSMLLAETKHLSKLTYASWSDQVKKWLETENGDNLRIARGSILENPLVLFDYSDDRLLLRVLLDQLLPDDEVMLDLSDVYEGGWVQPPDPTILNAQEESFTKDSTPPIIITEGTFDVFAIQSAIEILRPHLVGYVRFLDFEQKNDGGASASVRLVRALAAAGVTNRVLALFDNDTAAREELLNIQKVKLPQHFKVMSYPDIDLAKNYPTTGPQGATEMDVNGYAGSIELYLGRDSLTNTAGQLTPIAWKGKMERTGDYQGEISAKGEVQKRYRQKVAACKKTGVREGQDWSGMEAIIDKIIVELSTLQFVKDW